MIQPAQLRLGHVFLRVTGCLLLVLGGGCTRFHELQLKPQLERANTEFRRGEFMQAATRYESLIDRYPETPRREELMMCQAESLYALNDYHSARDVFLRYLNEYPYGQFAADAREKIKKIETFLSPRSSAREQAIAEAQNDLNKLSRLWVEHPHDPAVAYALANVYYDLGDYGEAARYYYEAQSLDAAYKEKSLLAERLALDEAGNPIPMGPQQVAAVEREKRPLVIFNQHEYNSRDHETVTQGGELQFFNVTALIRNQSSRLLSNVAIEVRYLNQQGSVLDTELVRLGMMGPGEVRAFRSTANSYDNLYNITSYELIPLWEDE